MIKTIKEKATFYQKAPAAEEIFAHLKLNDDLSQSPWGFDSGSVSPDAKSATANFSCVAFHGWGKDLLSVSAHQNPDGTWHVSHVVVRAPKTTNRT